MVALLPLPRLVFGPGAIESLPAELALFDVKRPLLLSDRGIDRAGIAAHVRRLLPATTVEFFDVPENPTVAGADAASAFYRDGRCDGVVALGGGSVLDTAKFVAALAGNKLAFAAQLLGKPELIGADVAPLIAIPTTVGTGSESSPVAALHLDHKSPAVGTRGFRLVPRLAICDPDLTRTLPPRLIAATGIDALSHCLEGFFANPSNPIVDALALDGIARVVADIQAAIEPDGHAARGSLMAAAFAGGAAIHKGLGPAHAVALACGDQDYHHGTLIGIALPVTIEMVAQHATQKADRIARAIGETSGLTLGVALRKLTRSLGLPESLGAIGYRADSRTRLVEMMFQSPFNSTSPYAPTREDYQNILDRLLS